MNIETEEGAAYDTGKGRWRFGDPIYRDGKVVRQMLGPCPACGSPTHEYGGSWSCCSWHCPKSAANFACSAGPIPNWWNTDIRVYLDGDQWCAVGAGFVDLQESPAGFGNTPHEAVEALRQAQPEEDR